MNVKKYLNVELTRTYEELSIDELSIILEKLSMKNKEFHTHARWGVLPNKYWDYDNQIDVCTGLYDIWIKIDSSYSEGYLTDAINDTYQEFDWLTEGL